MLLPFFSSIRQLNQQDFYFLHHRFSREINTLLPVHAAPVFWSRPCGYIPAGSATLFSVHFHEQLGRVCASGRPERIDGTVVIPVATEDGGYVAVILNEIDPALAEKMAPDWLQELQTEISAGLTRTKQHFVHPETGLYNSRLLEICLEQPSPRIATIFLLSIVHRSRQTTRELLRIVRTARLLEGSVAGPVMYLGGTIYAAYQEGLERDGAMMLSRRLIGRLKREGAQRVHIGLAVQSMETENPGQPELFRQCWRSLETAERRGPYSLCEALSLLAGEKHPLAQPSEKCMRQLRRSWQGREKFGLLLFRDEQPNPDTKDNVPLAGCLSGLIESSGKVVELSRSASYIVLPDLAGKETVRIGRKLKKRLEERRKNSTVALGIAHWPCLRYPKTETARNCRRALMHGDFLGPGSTTVFNHVSLNVSGDSFFDEGDYRQAVRDYRNGLLMHPNEINLLNSMGVALTELNRHREAGLYFEQVLQRDPSNFMALVNKGFSLRMQGRISEALSCFEKASRSRKFVVSPVFVDLSLQLGRLYCDAGSYGKAIRVLARLEKNHPDKQGFLFYSLLGEAYGSSGKYRKAIDALQHAVRLNPYDAKSLSLLGELYAREEQGMDIALALCEKALSLDESSWQHWYRLALVREWTADHDGALAAVREAMRRSRQNTACLLLAGRLYLGSGGKKKALSVYRRLSTLLPGDKHVKQMRKQLEAKRYI